MEHKEEPLLSDSGIRSRALTYVSPYDREVQRAANWVRDIYEAQRTKDRALIQTLMGKADSVIKRWDSPKWKWDQHTGELIRELQVALDAAKEQGFTPTER